MFQTVLSLERRKWNSLINIEYPINLRIIHQNSVFFYIQFCLYSNFLLFTKVCDFVVKKSSVLFLGFKNLSCLIQQYLFQYFSNSTWNRGVNSYSYSKGDLGIWAKSYKLKLTIFQMYVNFALYPLVYPYLFQCYKAF